MPDNATQSDIVLVDHGSICILHGTTPAGQAWLDDNLPEDALHWGGVVVEPRYVTDILDGAALDGMIVAA